MEKEFLNKLQEKVEAEKVSVQDAVEQVAVIIQKEYAMFTSERTDEDFKSNVVVSFLIHGHSVFEKYKNDFGTFFNYLYSFVKGLIMTERKAKMQREIREKVEVLHSIENFYELEERNNFTLVVEDTRNIPYAYKPITKPELEQSVKQFMKRRSYDRLSKSLVILALKASFDITDAEISLICEEFKINKNDFYEIVEHLKSELFGRQDRRKAIEQVRNSAYYNHMRYNKDLTPYINSESTKKEFQKKYTANTSKWQTANTKLLNGKYHLSPSNESIAKALGISERLVCYYIHTFREKLLEIKKKIEID